MDRHREFQLLADPPEEQEALNQQSESIVDTSPSSGEDEPEFRWQYWCFIAAIGSDGHEPNFQWQYWCFMFAIGFLITSVVQVLDIDLGCNPWLTAVLANVPPHILARFMVAAILHILGLRFPDLSDGRRAAIAIAISSGPSLVIFDKCYSKAMKILENAVCP
ncbi:MAG: hypothetical protein LQ338_001809 [Usnochroma carphineum]|nr:MAG: hypothetical protein LQ338_001809 [Usnochroma carphineum]